MSSNVIAAAPRSCSSRRGVIGVAVTMTVGGVPGGGK
jgi:hypothetical protein